MCSSVACKVKWGEPELSESQSFQNSSLPQTVQKIFCCNAGQPHLRRQEVRRTRSKDCGSQRGEERSAHAAAARAEEGEHGARDALQRGRASVRCSWFSRWICSGSSYGVKLANQSLMPQLQLHLP